jgi:hypothetical protein
VPRCVRFFTEDEEGAAHRAGLGSHW